MLIDSTRIKAEGEGEWHARKHGGAKRRLWRKAHIGVDEQTLEIRAIEVTGSSVGDAPMLPELLDQILVDVGIGSVTADGAYDTRKCHDAVADRGAHAIILPRKNAKTWKPSTAGAIARNEALRTSEYLGRAILRKWSGYATPLGPRSTRLLYMLDHPLDPVGGGVEELHQPEVLLGLAGQHRVS